jgi:hypothetical protein
MTDTMPVQSLVRGPSGIGGGQNFDGSEAGAMYGYTLPSRVGERALDPGRLMMHIPGLFKQVDVWTPTGWVRQAAVTGGGEERPVPAGAIVGGVVYVRVLVPVDRVPDPGRQFVFYEATA